jgi:diguanylate cyclase (GGDEF)-like protein
MRDYIETPPDNVPPEKRRYFVFGSYVYLFALGAHTVFIPVFYLLGNTISLYNNILCVALDALCLVLHRRGRFNTAIFIFVCAIAYHTSYCILAFGKDNGLLYYYLTLVAIVFFSELRLPFKVIGAALLAGLCVVMFEYTKFSSPVTPLSDRVLMFWHISNALANFSAVAYTAFYFLRIADAAEEKLRYQATHDYLTGILNRSAIIQVLDVEVIRSHRGHSSLGVIMADIDHFKKLNDTRGHQAGDMVLSETASLLSSMLRPYDRMGRYGGEEFILVIPGGTLASTHDIAERMRIAVQNRIITFGDTPLAVTMSFGVTAIENPSFDYSIDGIIEIADRALYGAKKRGRNRVEKHRLEARARRDTGHGPGRGQCS